MTYQPNASETAPYPENSASDAASKTQEPRLPSPQLPSIQPEGPESPQPIPSTQNGHPPTPSKGSASNFTGGGALVPAAKAGQLIATRVTAGHPVPHAAADGSSPFFARLRNGWKRLPKAIRGTLWAGIFGSTAIATAGLGAIAVLTLPLPSQVSGETVAPPLAELWRSGFRYQVSRPVNILVMGLDEARDVPGAQPGDLVGRTDTMLLVRVDPEDKAVNVLSIPRDTRVEIPGYGVEKINQANFEGGPQLAAQTIVHNFGDVKIDRYVRVSTVAFREIVDLVGGVEVYVPKPMQYEDKTQGLVIDLKPGLQMLNGSEAEQFARFRQDSYGDIGRVQRQQILLKALRKRLTNPTVLPKLPQIVRILQRYIDTNLSAEELLALAGFGLDLESDNLHMVMLPGRFSDPEEYSASFWLADQVASSDLMRTYFKAQPTDLVADANGVNYFDPPTQAAIAGMKIAIQNATDDPYASSSMAEYLRDQGFYEVYVMEDWPEVNRKTAVVAQRGDLGSARSVQSILNMGQVISDSTGDIDSDLTIRVGEDWLSEVDPTWRRLPYDIAR